jgi:hypothetical protein
LAFAFEAPGASVINHTPASPISGFASQTGTWRGGLAPTAFASSGIHRRDRAGSSSTAL